jgi:hypothetical protein
MFLKRDKFSNFDFRCLKKIYIFISFVNLIKSIFNFAYYSIFKNYILLFFLEKMLSILSKLLILTLINQSIFETVIAMQVYRRSIVNETSRIDLISVAEKYLLNEKNNMTKRFMKRQSCKFIFINILIFKASKIINYLISWMLF